MKIFIISLLIRLSMIECNDFEDAVHELEHLMKPARNTCSALEKNQCRGTCRIKSQEYCDEQNRNCYFDAKPVCRTKNKHIESEIGQLSKSLQGDNCHYNLSTERYTCNDFKSKDIIDDLQKANKIRSRKRNDFRVRYKQKNHYTILQALSRTPKPGPVLMYLCIPCYNQVLSLLRSDLSFSDSRVEAERLIIAYRLVRNCNYPMTKQRKQFLKFIIDSLTKSFVTSENALFLLKKIKQIQSIAQLRDRFFLSK